RYLDNVVSTSNQSQSDLGKRISDYRAVLKDLSSQKSVDSANKAIRILLCRDAIADSVVTDRAISSEDFTVLNELDNSLKANSEKMLTAVGPRTFASWRETRQPAKNAWWWFLDE